MKFQRTDREVSIASIRANFVMLCLTSVNYSRFMIITDVLLNVTSDER